MEIKKKENNKNHFYSHTNTDTLHACVYVYVCQAGREEMSPVQMSRTNPLDYVCPCHTRTHTVCCLCFLACACALVARLLAGIFDARILQDNARSLAPPTDRGRGQPASRAQQSALTFAFVSLLS